MSEETLHKVIFYNRGQIYEVYARGVGQAPLHGFVEIEALTFDERSQVVVDPSEERLKTEFEGVKRTYIPMHAVIRIDEVEKKGTGKITSAEGNVTPFPTSLYGPGGGKGE